MFSTSCLKENKKEALKITTEQGSCQFSNPAYHQSRSIKTNQHKNPNPLAQRLLSTFSFHELGKKRLPLIIVAKQRGFVVEVGSNVRRHKARLDFIQRSAVQRQFGTRPPSNNTIIVRLRRLTIPVNIRAVVPDNCTGTGVPFWSAHTSIHTYGQMICTWTLRSRNICGRYTTAAMTHHGQSTFNI